MSSSVRGSAATLSSAFVVAALGVLSASAQLNPTVKVLPKPQTSVPTECEEGLAPAVPRVIVAEAAQETKPSRATPPPSLDLKTQLRAVQLAAERGDRDAFKSSFADARAAVASYPRGGERNAANDIVSVYSDLERLWDYEFSSPTGGFFDSSTDFVSMMRRYPNYPRAIADQTLTAGGQTMYPSVETRRFLIVEASQRLSDLGVRTPTRIVEVPPPAPVPVPRAVHKKPAVRKAERNPPRTTPHPSQHKAARKPVAKKTKPPVKVAEARGAPTPSAARKPAAEGRSAPPPPMPVSAPAPVRVPTPQPTVAPMPPPATTTTAAEGRSALPPPMPVSAPAPAPVPTQQPTVAPMPQPATTATAAEGRGAQQIPPLPTDTMSKTETTATTATTAPAQTPTPSGGRMNLLFAIILIIVGIGVLIILFRASD